MWERLSTLAVVIDICLWLKVIIVSIRRNCGIIHLFGNQSLFHHFASRLLTMLLQLKLWTISGTVLGISCSRILTVVNIKILAAVIRLFTLLLLLMLLLLLLLLASTSRDIGQLNFNPSRCRLVTMNAIFSQGFSHLIITARLRCLRHLTLSLKNIARFFRRSWTYIVSGIHILRLKVTKRILFCKVECLQVTLNVLWLHIMCPADLSLLSLP